MSKQAAEIAAPGETRAAIACRLRHRTARPGLSATAGEVEIENISAEPIEIEVTMHPLQYLNVLVTDETGNVLPAPPYGHLFSPREGAYVLRLAPGEKYTHNVSLLGTLIEEKQLPGTYTVRCVYEYGDLKAVSEPVRVEIPSKETNKGISVA